MVMVTLTTGIIFLLFIFECGEFYESGPRVRRTAYEVVRDRRKFEKH